MQQCSFLAYTAWKECRSLVLNRPCIAAPARYQTDKFVSLTGEAYQFAKYIDGNSTFQIQVRSAIDLAEDRIFLVESRKMTAAQLTEVKAVLTSYLQDIAAIKFDDPMCQHLADSL